VECGFLSWIRALVGAVIGFIIFRLEGWPVSLIIDFLNLPSDWFIPMLYLTIGIIIGSISGTIFFGAISSSILMPSLAVFYTFFLHGGSIINYFQIVYQMMPLSILAVGGLLGGALSEKLNN
jgi:hypothetical protein